MIYYQQGDVLLKSCDRLPEDLECLTGDGRLVLQHGESTGHMHKFTKKSNVDVYVRPGATKLLNHGMTIVPGIGKFIIVREPSILRHEEHKEILIPPGIYEMDLVREYDYSKDEIVRVTD